MNNKQIKTEFSSGGVIYRAKDGIKEVLLIRIRKEKYELPKGHIEAGESEEQAALRECYEETGFQGLLDIDDYLGEINYSFKSDNIVIDKKVTYFSIFISQNGNFSKPKETHELRWIGKLELDSVEFVNHDIAELLQGFFNKA